MMAGCYFGKRVEIDKQHRTVCCASCHVMLRMEEAAVPTKYGDFRCLDCVDRSDADGFPIRAQELLKFLLIGGDVNG